MMFTMKMKKIYTNQFSQIYYQNSINMFKKKLHKRPGKSKPTKDHTQLDDEHSKKKNCKARFL